MKRSLSKGRSQRFSQQSFDGRRQLSKECGSDSKHLWRLECCFILLLLCFGIYQSILYFGHQAVPNPDFTGFVATGRQILSFEIPSNFKRAPVLGILQVLLSKVISGPHPELTAGWLLNALLHPLNAVLIYLIGRQFIGLTAVWVALISMLNPWVISMLCQPLVETTLLFFVLLTVFLTIRRSKWCYLFASITTMTRYEGAALIFTAFVLDLIYEKTWKKRIFSFVCSILASVPFMLWMLGTILNFKGQGETYYLKELGHAGTLGDAFIRYMQMFWQSAFYPLFQTVSKETSALVSILSKIIAATGVVLGVVIPLIKKNWKILALLLFLVPYIFVHAAHSVVLARYCTTVNWMVVLICVSGLRHLWHLLTGGARIPKPVIICFQAVVLTAVLLWIAYLFPYLSKAAPLSKRSVTVPYLGAGAVGVVFLCRRLVYRIKLLWPDICTAALFFLMIISNQLVLSNVVGNGRRDIEFKMLAQWCKTNTNDGDKILSSMNNVVRIFIPQRSDDILHIGIDADSPQEFVRKCYEKDVKYVTWDSRIGLSPGSRYYKLWKIENIAFLARPKSVGPYEFVTQIRVDRQRYINIFRLKRPGEINRP